MTSGEPTRHSISEFSSGDTIRYCADFPESQDFGVAFCVWFIIERLYAIDPIVGQLPSQSVFSPAFKRLVENAYPATISQRMVFIYCAVKAPFARRCMLFGSGAQHLGCRALVLLLL